jgi:hypothetical protein
MRSLFLLSLAAAVLPTLPAPTVQPPFSALYTIANIGSVPGIPFAYYYGSIVFDRSDPNLLLVSRWNGPAATPNLYAARVTRDAAGHVTGFSGTATLTNEELPGIDGGLAYHPSGVLFYTRYITNEVGQLKPGSTTPDRVDPLLAPTTVGGLAIVPAGMPGAGRLKTVRWPNGVWTDATLTPDGNGTFNIVNETATVTLTGGPDGILYLPPYAPFFNGADVLVAEYSAGRIVSYQIDAIGDPILATQQVVVDQIAGTFAFALDPVTFDVLHVNWNAATIDVIQGFGLSCGQCSHYGAGLAGTGGVPPVITNLACARSNQTTGVHVQGVPGLFGGIVMGFVQTSIPLFGGTLLNEGSATALHLLSASGQFRLNIPVPNNINGFTVRFQAGYLDGGAPQGVSMSDGLSMPIL